MHLRYFLDVAALDCKITQHPQKVMRELGITYQHATPQSMGDQWWFWNCTGVPLDLPKFLYPLDIIDPHKYIGHGLSKEDADKIASWKLEA